VAHTLTKKVYFLRGFYNQQKSMLVSEVMRAVEDCARDEKITKK